LKIYQVAVMNTSQDFLVQQVIFLLLAFSSFFIEAFCVIESCIIMCDQINTVIKIGTWIPKNQLFTILCWWE